MAKYRNKKVTIDNIEFDSKLESERYCELKLLQKAGLINNIKIAFNNVNKTTIVASAMVGTFNTLGIFDPETLGTLDPYYLGDMDFNQT